MTAPGAAQSHLHVPSLLAAVVAAVLLLGVSATPASALVVGLQADRSSPEVGEGAVFTASANEPNVSYEFVVDGVSRSGDAGAPHRLTHAFATTGAHMVRAIGTSSEHDEAFADVNVTVVPALTMTVSRTPNGPAAGQTVRFTASPAGGKAPLTVSWDFTSDGSTDATGATVTTAFAQGSHLTRARVTDAANPAHSVVAEVTTNVGPASAATCTLRRLADGVAGVKITPLAELETSLCWVPQGGGRFAEGAANEITLNGLRIQRVYDVPDLTAFPLGVKQVVSGPIVYTEPTTRYPGGRLVAKDVAITVGKVGMVYRGDLDLALPDAPRGAERRLATLDRLGNTLFGLSVSGQLPLRLGHKDSRRYVEMDLTVALPDPIRDAPPEFLSGVSPRRVQDTATVRVDNQEIHYGSVRLQKSLAWIGPLPVFSLCWAYAGAGTSGSNLCPELSVDSKPYLVCDSGETKDRWGGTARLQLPIGSEFLIGMFTSLANGKLASLGALRDNFGGPLLGPIKQLFGDGFTLNRLGFGVCAQPLQLRGDAGAAYFAPKVGPAPLEIDGKVLYTAQTQRNPWSLEVTGNASVFKSRLGTATLTFKPGGHIDFKAKARINIDDVLKIEGDIDGWIAAKSLLYSMAGDVRGCAGDVCGSAKGLVTSTGAAACIDAGSITIETVKKKKNWKWYAPWRVKLETKTIQLQAGAGYRWRDQDVDVVGGECGFKPYKVQRPSRIRQAAGAGTVSVASGTTALALRIAGSSGPPKIRVSGPGFDIVSPAGESGSQVPGSFMLIEDDAENVTHLVLVRPAPGTYTITSADPSNAISAIQGADPVQPFAAAAQVRRASRGRRMLTMSYTKPEGTRLRIIERSASVRRTLVNRVAPQRCRGPRVSGVTLLCLDKRFRPAPGPGGRRTIEAILERNGIPVQTTAITSYRAPAQRRPSRPRVRIQRSGRGVRVAWTRSRGASSYAVNVYLSSKRSFGWKLASNCRSVAIRRVGRRVRVRARVTALREDMRAGRQGRAYLYKRGANNVGSSKIKLRRLCR